MVFNSNIDFKNDLIYFVLLDRFHDGQARDTMKSNLKAKGYGNAHELFTFYGGTLKGVEQKLLYIKKLGFTAVWLSPFFHNTNNAYHGYSIKDFLNIDPHFGTKDDLKSLVSLAHELNLKIYMDVIINHTGPVWQYLANNTYKYNQGLQYPFGKWSETDFPKPKELKNENFYERKGQIQNWDQYPELMLGDFFELKKLKLDQSEQSLKLQDILIAIYSYWQQEFDIDGFRLDTARHIQPWVLARFCDRIKTNAHQNGKRSFPIFIEAPFLTDLQLAQYFSTMTDENGKLMKSPDGYIDFMTHFLIPEEIQRKKGFQKVKRYAQKTSEILKKNHKQIYRITFLDNHDQVGENYKSRISHKISNSQIVKAWRFLTQTQSIPCMYYGTEQGLSGHGNHDRFIREAMFDRQNLLDLHRESYVLFKSIRKVNLQRLAKISHSIYSKKTTK